MVSVEVARQQWEEGYRRLEAEAADARRPAQLLGQVEVLTQELRRRVGAGFTLAELAEHYPGADRWAAEVVQERAPSLGWARSVATAADAAFHLYSRGARDYRP